MANRKITSPSSPVRLWKRERERVGSPTWTNCYGYPLQLSFESPAEEHLSNLVGTYLSHQPSIWFKSDSTASIVTLESLGRTLAAIRSVPSYVWVWSRVGFITIQWYYNYNNINILIYYDTLYVYIDSSSLYIHLYKSSGRKKNVCHRFLDSQAVEDIETLRGFCREAWSSRYWVESFACWLDCADLKSNMCANELECSQNQRTDRHSWCLSVATMYLLSAQAMISWFCFTLPITKRMMAHYRCRRASREMNSIEFLIYIEMQCIAVPYL